MRYEGIVEMVSGTSVLEVQGLSYTYQRNPVLENVSLSLKKGEIAFLHGSNGSGKTTLLLCLAGWSAYKKGTIFLLGEKFSGVRQKQKEAVCFVPDTPVFYEDLTAEEHIRFVLNVRNRQDCMVYAESLLDKFGLTAYRTQFPSTFSRGMRMKLALVIAFMVKPSLLLLDEPYGSLDKSSSEILSREIQQSAAEGTSVILSLHQQSPLLRPDSIWQLEGKKLSLVEKTESIEMSSQW